MSKTSKIFCAIACVVLFSGTASAQQNGGMSMKCQQGMQESPDAMNASYDLKFIDTMSHHHRMGIAMMKLADQRAQHDELKEMAREGIETQEKEIEQLQAWKTAWYPNGPDSTTTMMPCMMGSMKGMSMEKLESSSGAAFDKMFIDMMSKHHRSAIEMSKDAINKAKHPELKQFAQKLVDEQTKEVAQMAKWKKDWKSVEK